MAHSCFDQIIFMKDGPIGMEGRGGGEGNGRSALLERQGCKLAFKAGEAVIGDQGNRNSRKDSKENSGT